jgi:hypothetical protein
VQQKLGRAPVERKAKIVDQAHKTGQHMIF